MKTSTAQARQPINDLEANIRILESCDFPKKEYGTIGRRTIGINFGSPDLYRAAALAARTEGISVSAFVRRLVIEGVRQASQQALARGRRAAKIVPLGLVLAATSAGVGLDLNAPAGDDRSPHNL